MKTNSVTPAVWAERYETLRQYVLDSRQSLGADPLGLVLLLRQGVADWMRSWRKVDVPMAPQLSSTPAPAASHFTPDWQRQLTALLAQMTSSQLFGCSAV